MIGIKVKKGEDINRAIRRFSTLCERNGILSDAKNERYEKPSAARRAQRNKAIYEQKKLKNKNRGKLY